MEYKITYTMAIELLHRYLEKIYALNRHNGMAIVKVQQLFDYSIELKGLVDQLRADGHNVDQILREIKEGLERKYRFQLLEIYVDGSARNNNDVSKENVSGTAMAIYGDSQLVYEQTKLLGGTVKMPRLKNDPIDVSMPIVPATNNVAEYMAIIHALEYLLEHQLAAKNIEIISDSEMIVSFINRLSTARSEQMIKLRNYVWELMGEFNNLTILHELRHKNEYVDTLLCQTLDEVQGYIRDPSSRVRMKALEIELGLQSM